MHKTPKNIEELHLKELLDLIDDTNAGNIPKKEVRYKIIRLVYEILGYTISKDLLLALVAEPKAQLVLATAGGGKTTFSQVKIIIEKILRKTINGEPIEGDKVLCLVYNKHNVKQMTDKHEQLVRKLYASGIQGLDIDSNLRARTMHSFCNMWAQEYIGKTGLLGSSLLKDSEVSGKLGTVFKVICKKHKLDCEEKKVDDLISLYNLLKETLTEYVDCDNFELFLTLQLPKEVIVETFNAYDAMKNRQHLYDFTDMLHKLLKLLREDEKVRTHIQNYYTYIVADEVQDLTPVMMEILRLVKGPNTPILCIGDEDQNIYGFRGASIDNTLNFTNLFESAEVYTLATNRRCGKNIVDLSKKVVSWNTLRYEKDIEASREGGVIEFAPYKTYEGQMINLMRRLEAMTNHEINNTCICYRNKRSSLILSDRLEKARIPFHILSGYKPFTHEIYRHMIDILDLLYMPYDREYLINLYKICPGITRAQLYECIGYNPKDRSWTVDREHKHFAQYDYGKYNTHAGFQKTLQILTAISNKISKMPMKEYMHDLFYLFDLGFWQNKAYLNNNAEVDDLYREECEKFFSSELAYPTFFNEYSTRRGVFERNDKTHTGLTLSTFHGLKGLEFDTVILIDLEDEIFPNFAKIDAIECYSDKTKLTLKEGETRLFFVAVTRAKDNLIMYYNEDCPSIYIDWLLQEKENQENESSGVIDKSNIDIKKIFTQVGTSRESNLVSERMNMFDNLINKVSESFEESENKPVVSVQINNTDELESNEELLLDDEPLSLDGDSLLEEDDELTLEEDDELTLDDSPLEEADNNDFLLEDEGLSLDDEPLEINESSKTSSTFNEVLDLSEKKVEKEPPKFKSNNFMSSILDRI